MPVLPCGNHTTNHQYVLGVRHAEVKRNAVAFRTEASGNHTNNEQYVHGVRLADVKRSAGAFRTETKQKTSNTFTLGL